MSSTISFLDINNYHPLDSLNPDKLKEYRKNWKPMRLKKVILV